MATIEERVARSCDDTEWSLADCKMRIEAEGEATPIALRAARPDVRSRDAGTGAKMTSEEATPPTADSTQGSGRSWPDTHKTFGAGDKVRKVRGSQWRGRVVGWYSTELTPEGYAVESDTERGSVQIYPASALERAL